MKCTCRFLSSRLPPRPPTCRDDGQQLKQVLPTPRLCRKSITPQVQGERESRDEPRAPPPERTVLAEQAPHGRPESDDWHAPSSLCCEVPEVSVSRGLIEALTWTWPLHSPPLANAKPFSRCQAWSLSSRVHRSTWPVRGCGMTTEL